MIERCLNARAWRRQKATGGERERGRERVRVCVEGVVTTEVDFWSLGRSSISHAMRVGTDWVDLAVQGGGRLIGL